MRRLLCIVLSCYIISVHAGFAPDMDDDVVPYETLGNHEFDPIHSNVREPEHSLCEFVGYCSAGLSLGYGAGMITVNKLYDPHDSILEESIKTGAIVPMLGASFIGSGKSLGVWRGNAMSIGMVLGYAVGVAVSLPLPNKIHNNA